VSEPYTLLAIVVLDYDPLPQSLRLLQVPNTDRPLPIQCPKCQHNGSKLVVRSLTVMSVTCAKCGHFWATDLESLPPEIQEKIPDALRDL
jgi:Zn ribbon nucleic-acid-binding protein